MEDIMIDLETMGTGPNAAIIAIGAVAFSIPEQNIHPETFYEVVDLESSIRTGGIINASTVIWWMKQSDEARNSITREEGRHIENVLYDFSEWVYRFNVPIDQIKVWGNGAAFDNVVLGSAYDRIGLTRPWTYKGDRCYLTMRNMYPKIEIPDMGITHNALDDAIYQANYLMRILTEKGK
jgi:exodeoxyribonuclease VIII